LHISLIYLACIIFLYLFALLFILLYHYYYFTYIHTLCLTTTRWSWGRKIRRFFCRFPDENEESFFDCSLRVQYKPRVSSWGKFTLATTLCTWSPNEVAHFLVSSRLFCGAVAVEQRKALITASFREQRQFSDARSSSSALQPKLGEVAPL
jgi:hypothetical protein